jgi:hypothetical protein
MRCKNCRDKFEPKAFNQKYCLKEECTDIGIKVILEKAKDKKKKDWNKEKKERKEKLKTTSDYVKELEAVFNKYIRLRDTGLPCISCNKYNIKKKNAGHYRSKGGFPELRFDELNVHLQCEYCNTYLHGNLIDYRINLITRIGLDKVEWLESKHMPKKYTKNELLEMKELYKNKIKELTK